MKNTKGTTSFTILNLQINVKMNVISGFQSP